MYNMLGRYPGGWCKRDIGTRRGNAARWRAPRWSSWQSHCGWSKWWSSGQPAEARRWCWLTPSWNLTVDHRLLSNSCLCLLWIRSCVPSIWGLLVRLPHKDCYVRCQKSLWSCCMCAHRCGWYFYKRVDSNELIKYFANKENYLSDISNPWTLTFCAACLFCSQGDLFVLLFLYLWNYFCFYLCFANLSFEIYLFIILAKLGDSTVRVWCGMRLV